MDNLIKLLYSMLIENRFVGSNLNSANFKLSNSHMGIWTAQIVIGKQDTCAAIIYEGNGNTTDEALKELVHNVIDDKRIILEDV